MAQVEVIEGLQIWSPEVSFLERYNIVSFSEGIAGLSAVDVKFDEDTKTLYCTDSEGIARHVVDKESIDSQIAQIKNSEKPLACMSAEEIPIYIENRYEEAVARGLHLGLGRACLLVAAYAEQQREFRAATRDLKHVFAMLYHPAYSHETLIKGPRPEGLLYMFSSAAKKQKTITTKEAAEITDSLSRGLLDGREWLATTGVNFRKKIGFEEKKLQYRQSKAHKSKTLEPDKAIIINSEHEERRKAPKTDAEIFVMGLDIMKKKMTAEERLKHVHQYYCIDRNQELPDWAITNQP